MSAFRIVVSFVIVASLGNCTKDEFVFDPEPYRYENPPLQGRTERLKILSIGNSFSEDALLYLPGLLSEAGIDDVTLGNLYCYGASLVEHLEYYEKNRPVYAFRVSQNGEPWKTVADDCVAAEAVRFAEWNVIVLQERPSLLASFESATEPCIGNLVHRIRSDCSVARPTFCWHMTWAFSSDCTNDRFAAFGFDPDAMYRTLSECARVQLAGKLGFHVIPSGTAIENLRITSVNNPPADLMRDGYHADYGAGCYTAACTWFEALVSPTTGVSVVGNALRTGSGTVPVTDANAAMCQQAARDACLSPYETTIPLR